MNSTARRKKYGLWLVACGFWFLISNWLDYQAFAQNLTPSNPSPIAQGNNKDRVRSVCLEQDIETLTTQLLRDLPSYANRIIQRARRLRRSTDVYSYVLVAGRPEFTPLPLNPSEDTDAESKNASKDVEQVFFTTLERQYVGEKAVELQQFHWLFLTKAKSGWWMVTMFSQTGSYPKNNPPTPPRDSSNGVVAQGIRMWLRDCRAGSVRFGN
ncbi:MAG: hypothetical protein N2235_11850 [Fischerella sp.]|nr:hypothetical protein [Fischerella sp.]